MSDDLLEATIYILVGMFVVETLEELLPRIRASPCSERINTIMLHSRKKNWWKMQMKKRGCHYDIS